YALGMAALIFTDELREKATGELDGSAPLILRWAGAQGEGGEQVRRQIEGAAALVPEEKRPRVLGPLSPTAKADQVKAPVGVLFIAKMLHDLGWSVDFEPVLGTQTPDLLIRRDTVEYIVEVRRVFGRAAEDNQARLLVQRALKGIRTATPLNIRAMCVDGSA